MVQNFTFWSENSVMRIQERKKNLSRYYSGIFQNFNFSTPQGYARQCTLSCWEKKLKYRDTN